MSEVLENECRLLHAQIFKLEAPAVIVGRYIESHQFLSLPGNDYFATKRTSILKWNLDCEALEFYWRLFRKDRTLTAKFSILFFLTENQADYFPTFYQKKDDRVKACLQLVNLGFRSFYLLAKGFFLDRWLRLV